MKLNKIFLVSIFLLAIFMMAPLCASDANQTDDLSISDENSVPYTADVKNTTDIISDGEDNFNDEYEENPEDNYEDDYVDDYDNSPQQVALKVKYPKTIYANDPTEFTFTSNYLFEGTIKVTVDGKNYTKEFECENTPTINIKDLTPGVKTVSYYADFDWGYSYDAGNFTINVVKKPILQANDLTKYSIETKTYKVRLLDPNNKPLAGKTLKFYIEGKYINSAKTDGKGYAKTKISYSNVGKNMELTIAYGDAEYTKKITVKSVFKPFKTANVKNAKKLTLQVNTNKINGKYLKGKIVTLKILGKKYKVKINSKGVVKLTLPQKIFKKCSYDGYTYYIVDAFLGKDTAWAGIIFSKVKPTLSYQIVTRLKGAA